MKKMNVKRLDRIRTGLRIAGFVIIALTFTGLIIPIVLGVKSFVITNASMEPTLSIGDVIYVKEVPFEEINEQDILTIRSFVDPGRTFTHRVVQLIALEQMIITKGDANASVDPSPVLYANVIGRVEFIVPWFGHVILFVRSIPGIITLALLVLTYSGFSFAIDVEKKQSTPKGSESDE
jgi:signal peptidase I